MVGPIEISRGCPWGCKYCQVTYTHGAFMRHRSIENIVYWINRMIECNAYDIRFISPNAFSYGGNGIKINHDQLNNLFNMLYEYSRRNSDVRIFLGSFPSEIRPDFITDELIKQLSKIVSNKRIVIGVQSASENLLKKMNRGHSVNDVEESIIILNKYGFRADLDFIFGLPEETNEDIELTLKFIDKITRKYWVKIHAHTFIPLPGSPYSRMKPKPLSIKLRRKIYKLIGDIKLYGQWEWQEEISRKIIKLKNKKIIFDLKFLTENLKKNGKIFKVKINS